MTDVLQWLILDNERWRHMSISNKSGSMVQPTAEKVHGALQLADWRRKAQENGRVRPVAWPAGREHK